MFRAAPTRSITGGSIFRLALFGLVVLLAACAKPPRQELDAAEYLLARANAYQAANYAPSEYQAASEALDESRRLIARGKYRAAETALAFSRQHALRAYSLTEAAKAYEAEQEEMRRAAEEVARLQAEETARLRAVEEARLQAEEEARRKADEEARRAAEARLLSSYRVGKGDNLASISAMADVYGDPLLWPLIYQANRDQIKDPAHIFVGQTLTIPRNVAPADLEAARQKARESGLFSLAPVAHQSSPTN